MHLTARGEPKKLCFNSIPKFQPNFMIINMTTVSNDLHLLWPVPFIEPASKARLGSVVLRVERYDLARARASS
jgi:hypothetical protein